MSIIKHLKDVFMVMGGGTQFTSQEFKDFTTMWGIQYKVSSTNAQSNGQAECFVQTIKNNLTKAIEGGRGYISSYPRIHHNTLESQSTLPSRAAELKKIQVQQNCIQQYRRMMQQRKHQQAKYSNWSTRDLPSLNSGDAVYVQQVPNTRKWISGIVINRVSADHIR